MKDKIIIGMLILSIVLIGCEKELEEIIINDFSKPTIENDSIYYHYDTKVGKLNIKQSIEVCRQAVYEYDKTQFEKNVANNYEVVIEAEWGEYFVYSEDREKFEYLDDLEVIDCEGYNVCVFEKYNIHYADVCKD